MPAMYLPGAILVITPLLALMADQLLHLPSCLTGASITSTTTPKKKREIMEGLMKGQIKVLFISPEVQIQPSLCSSICPHK